MNRRDAGAALVWSLALVSVLMLVATVGLVLASLAVTRQRAASVADVAALTAAQSLSEQCGHAASVAAGNGMRLEECSVDGTDVLVRVAAPPPAVVVRAMALLGGMASDVTADARSGLP